MDMRAKDPDSQDVEWLRRELGERRVALVHDWITGYRGGEKVLEAIASFVPRADLYTLIHVRGASHPVIEKRCVRASWMNRLPGVRRYYRWLLPLFPAWADRLDLSGYDLVLSTSHCVAKGVRAPSGAAHVCYCHTPMRYVWDRFEDYFGHVRGPQRRLLRWQASRLRSWDRRSADRVDHYLANSHFVRGRILEYYGLEPSRVSVVHPPVDLRAFPEPGEPPGRSDRYLVVSALVPYKRIDVAVEACARSGRGLDVVGSGPGRSQLEDRVRRLGAGGSVRFLGFVPDEDLGALLRRGRALLFPGIEDFGITPVEATACGLPTVALAQGGALDTIVDGLNGVLYERATVDGLLEGLERFENMSESWDGDRMREHARNFDRPMFLARYARELRAVLEADPGERRRSARGN
jgi:glycosyltransferase involved in cell wall biosynthesis